MQSPGVPPSPPGDARAKPWLSPRAALRSPLSSSSPFTSSLAMVPHATPSLCMGIQLSVPQASSTLLYGRAPVVSHRGGGLGVLPVPWAPAGLAAIGKAPLHRLVGCGAGGIFRDSLLLPLMSVGTRFGFCHCMGGYSEQGACTEPAGLVPGCAGNGQSPALVSSALLLMCPLLCAGGV